jgi:alpha-tubulin suppressor-like RCC1 family protein
MSNNVWFILFCFFVCFIDLTILIPSPVPGLPPLSKVACAEHHSLFLTRNNEVYSVGRGEDGRLGHGDNKNYETPTRIEYFNRLPNGDKVVDISVGECHSLIVTEQGHLYTFGYGDLLQLGQGIEQDESSPVLLTSKEIDEMGESGLGRAVVQAAGGAQHSIILTVARTKPAPGKNTPAAAASAPAQASAAAAATANGQ